MAQAGKGAFNGTVFHRVVRHGIIQGGDPLTTDPGRGQAVRHRRTGHAAGGTVAGGKHARGTVSAVLQPGKPDSAGSQFFVCVTEQPALDGKYTIFGRVSEGMDVVQKISEAPATPTACRPSASSSPASRSGTRRSREPDPFCGRAPRSWRSIRAMLDTAAGP